MLLFFSKGIPLKYQKQKRNNNSLLYISMLKYLVYYQVFGVEVRCLQDQLESIWILVLFYCVSNILQRKKIWNKNVMT